MPSKLSKHVTEHYGIPVVPRVPFLDVDVDVDKPMFLDPHAIRLTGGPQPFAAEAVRCMETFFHEVSRCVISQRPADRARGLDLLQHFEEPWETRLGLAAAGFQGHGGAQDVGAGIWHSLTTDIDMLLKVGILTQLEDIPLFVEGVGVDITSDLTTRIVFEPLARFTADMVAQYPQFTAAPHATRKVTRQIWDPVGLRWTIAQVDLPVVNGKELLLVPRDWARHDLLMGAGRFYETSVLGYVQDERAVRGANGRWIKPSKEDLQKDKSLARGRATILEVVLRAFDGKVNVLNDFKAFVDGKWEQLDDDLVQRKLG